MRPQSLDSAEDWLTYLLRGEVAEEDLEELEVWFARRPENRAELELLRRGWQLSGDLEKDPDLMVSRLLHADPAPSRGWRRVLLAAAAVTSVVASTLLIIKSQDPFLQHQTALGEQSLVSLADGSRIHLNTATTLNVAESGQRVQLLEGEAFFDIRTRVAERLVVDAGASKVVVLGTRFNVFREGDDVLISVLEGQVAVNMKIGAEEDDTSHRVAAGQTLEIRGAARPRLVADGPDLRRVKAWQDGKVEFDHTPLREALRELSRYTPESLSIAEPSLAELRVSGVFHIDRLTDLGSVQFALESSLPVRIRPAGKALELIPADS